jgi:hypothetical protein
VWTSAWTCPEHGEVLPFLPAPDPSADWVRHVCSLATVPVWLPWPLPDGWVVSSVAPVGTEVTGLRAVAVVLGGPHPLGGAAELMLLSEEPGTGLAGRLAGLVGTDPGSVVDGPPYTHVSVAGHPVPLWLVPSDDDHAVVVGERDLSWLWLLVRPASAGALLVDDLRVTDARTMGEEVRLLPYGARSDWPDAP